MPHSWAVWSLSPRVIGVYTACGIWAWASPLHAQSPAWGTIHPLARFCLCLVSFFDIGIVCKLRKWGYGGDLQWKTYHLLTGAQQYAETKLGNGSSPVWVERPLTFPSPPKDGRFLIQAPHHRFIFHTRFSLTASVHIGSCWLLPPVSSKGPALSLYLIRSTNIPGYAGHSVS